MNFSNQFFKKHIDQNDFVEWEARSSQHYYGTLKSEGERIWSEGKHAIFDIDVVGGLRIKEKFPERTLAVFVKAPSIEVMENRLRSRQTESEEKIQERLAKAEKELSYAEQFDVILVNDDLDTAKTTAEELIQKFTS